MIRASQQVREAHEPDEHPSPGTVCPWVEVKTTKEPPSSLREEELTYA